MNKVIIASFVVMLILSVPLVIIGSGIINRFSEATNVCDKKAEEVAEETCFKYYNNNEFRISDNKSELFCNNNGKQEKVFLVI